jgi:hypothetical protein
MTLPLSYQYRLHSRHNVYFQQYECTTHLMDIWKAFDSVCWLGCACSYTCATNLLVLTCWHRQLGFEKYKLTAYKYHLSHLDYVSNLRMQHIRWKVKFFLLVEHRRAMVKDKSCEQEKQKLWFLRPSQISELFWTATTSPRVKLWLRRRKEVSEYFTSATVTTEVSRATI